MKTYDMPCALRDAFLTNFACTLNSISHMIILRLIHHYLISSAGASSSEPPLTNEDPKLLKELKKLEGRDPILKREQPT